MNELLREKRRYGLKEEISPQEEILLAKGVPVQKIIGFIDFDDLKIKVDRKVLIPRYETQEVIEAALPFINKESKVLDLCTGSGYIGLTIKQKKDCKVTMSDIDEEAIIQSTINAKDNNLDVEIIKSDLFKNINGKFDLIISNPPYIPTTNKLDSSVLDYDPELALFGGKDGNDFYKQIIEEAPKHINKGGVLVFEISNDNTQFILDNGFKVFKDINKKDRIAIKHFD